MSTYAIGDIQGCYDELQALLTLIKFDKNHDRLWFTGDLVNRGEKSLETLRFIKKLGDCAVTVLGNHDIHLLRVAVLGKHLMKRADTLQPILEAKDSEELITWLRHRPFVHHDAVLGFTMLHAGLPPQWDFDQVMTHAADVENLLRGKQYADFLKQTSGDAPDLWSEDLHGWDRWRFITNCFTRMRYCDAMGKLNLKHKQKPINFEFSPKENTFSPWFVLPQRASVDMQIIFGHWSTLGFHDQQGVFALDTGCLWGGRLTALCLETLQTFTVPCRQTCVPNKQKSPY